MKLYAKYLKERENLSIIEINEGFIAYRFFQGTNGRKCCLIHTYYVLPTFRHMGHGYNLANKVLKMCSEKKVDAVYCQSNISAKGHRIAALSILNYGFDICALEGETVHYSMEVRKWEA